MRRAFPKNLYAMLCAFLLITASWAQATVSDEPTSIIALEAPVHFLAPDGSDVLVPSGAYTVEAADEWIRLIPGETRENAILVEARRGTHDMDLEHVLALSVPGDTEDQLDIHHVMLLLPGRTSLEATGTYSGIRQRGFVDDAWKKTKNTVKKVATTTYNTTKTVVNKSTTWAKGILDGKNKPVQPVLYGLDPKGNLLWYRHDGAPTGVPNWKGPKTVASGWQSYTRIVPGGGNVLYGIKSNGTLWWNRHNGAKNGTRAWKWKNVGNGWTSFKQVFSGSEGILYAISQNGTLKWYRHTGHRDGANTWAGPKNVGNGWANFKQVFGIGNGIIYAIANDGKLLWYKLKGFQNGTGPWEGPKVVGNGWANFKQVFGAGNGIIYAIDGGGVLREYHHIGYRNGTFNWKNPKVVGSAWQGFTKVVSLLPGQANNGIIKTIRKGPTSWLSPALQRALDAKKAAEQRARGAGQDARRVFGRVSRQAKFQACKAQHKASNAMVKGVGKALQGGNKVLTKLLESPQFKAATRQAMAIIQQKHAQEFKELDRMANILRNPSMANRIKQLLNPDNLCRMGAKEVQRQLINMVGQPRFAENNSLSPNASHSQPQLVKTSNPAPLVRRASISRLANTLTFGQQGNLVAGLGYSVGYGIAASGTNVSFYWFTGYMLGLDVGGEFMYQMGWFPNRMPEKLGGSYVVAGNGVSSESAGVPLVLGFDVYFDMPTESTPNYTEFLTKGFQGMVLSFGPSGTISPIDFSVGKGETFTIKIN